MTGLAIGALATTAIGTGVGVYSTYQQGLAAKEMAGQQAAAQLALAEAQAAAYGAQAGEYARQAAVEQKLAGVDQIQGELENEKRSKALAAEIGSTYAQAAGNGILVTSASPTDTFANVLKNEATEAAYDISDWTNAEASAIYWAHLGIPHASGHMKLLLQETIRQARILYDDPNRKDAPAE